MGSPGPHCPDRETPSQTPAQLFWLGLEWAHRRRQSWGLPGVWGKARRQAPLKASAGAQPVWVCWGGVPVVLRCCPLRAPTDPRRDRQVSTRPLERVRLAGELLIGVSDRWRPSRPPLPELTQAAPGNPGTLL